MWWEWLKYCRYHKHRLRLTYFVMDWQNEIVSIYANNSDKRGKALPIGEILRRDYRATILALRKLNPKAANYHDRKDAIKNGLPAFALNELAPDRKTVLLGLTGLIQLDFDYVQGDIEELKKAVFLLPFVAYCSLSCSGYGFYAIAAISEPEKQREYAEQVHTVFSGYGIMLDKGKGKSPNELRYVSYDENPLIKDNVEPLRIKRFCTSVSSPKKVITADTEADFEKVKYYADIIGDLEFDFAPTYTEYWNTALALANGLGEIGRELFHRICQHSPKYNYAPADRKYTEALKNGNGGITLGTFFNYCNAYGLRAKADFINVNI